MTRSFYGDDELYTRMATDSLLSWRALDAVAKAPILIPSGVLFLFGPHDKAFSATLDLHRRLAFEADAFSVRELQGRFPFMSFDGVGDALFERSFGAILAERAVATLVDEFKQLGGSYRQASIVPPAIEDLNLHRIRTLDGGQIEADVFVFAAGPWLPKLFPTILGGRLVATRQEVFYFEGPGRGEKFLPLAMPSWADNSSGTMFYGFPDLESQGLKFAVHKQGAIVDPDTQARLPIDAALQEVTAFRDRRFPALRGARLIDAHVCHYENTADADFIIDFHPEAANTVLVGGGSGHGFKHGPEVGRIAASLAAYGGSALPRFSLASKALVV